MTTKHVHVQQNGRLMLVIRERSDEVNLDLQIEGLSSVQIIRLLSLALSKLSLELGEREILLFRLGQNEHHIATVFCDVERARIESHTQVTGEEMVILLINEILQRCPKSETIDVFDN